MSSKEGKANVKEIEKQVIKIIADKLDIDPMKIKPNSRLIEDLGMDSFAAIETIFAFEEAFNMVISEEEARNFKNVKEIVTFLISKLTNKQG